MIPTPTQVRRDPALFASKFLRVRDKRSRLVRLTYNAAQLDYLSKRTGRDIILKARQLGFSTLIQAELFRRATTTRYASTATMAHDTDTTAKLRRMAQFYYDHLPEKFRPNRSLDNATTTSYTDTGSFCMIGTAGSKDKGRGGTYSDLHGSEVAYWSDAGAIIAGVGQGGNPRMELESTANGAQGWYYETAMEALNGSPDWTLHFYEWWWDEAYRIGLDAGEVLHYTDDEARLIELHGLDAEQIKWRRKKQRELKRTFLQEYPEDPISCFLLSGAGYFGALEGVFTLPCIEVEPGIWRIDDPVKSMPQEGHIYYAGADNGGKVDYTTLSIGDATTREQVSLLKVRHMSQGDMRRLIAKECTRWNVKLLAPERNSFEAQIEELNKLFPRMQPFWTDNQSKALAIGGLYDAFYEYGWHFLDHAEQAREHRALQTTQTATGAWRYAAPDKQHDDTVIANMLMIDATLRPSPSDLYAFMD